jgi:hypothetical protein
MYYFLYVLVIKLPNFVLKNNSQNTVSVHMIIIQTKLIMHSSHFSVEENKQRFNINNNIL